MSREIYEAVRDGEATEDASGLLTAFVQTLGRVRRERARGLAQSEYEDGLWVEDNEEWMRADLDGLSLAARDAPDLDFPVRYRGHGKVVLMGLGVDGQPYLLLEEGEGPIEVLGVTLELGVELPCTVDAPPFALVLGSGEVLRP